MSDKEKSFFVIFLALFVDTISQVTKISGIVINPLQKNAFFVDTISQDSKIPGIVTDPLQKNASFVDTISQDSKISGIVKDPLQKIVFQNKCIEDLGCFFTGPPFYHPVSRPVSLAPFGLAYIKTKFWLFTPSESETGTLMKPDSESLTKSSFNPDLPVKFITHGFSEAFIERNNPVFRLKDALLKQGDYNVFVVDWTGSSGPPYAQAVANTRVVGAQIAQMVKFLHNEVGVDPKNVHLIGHSLGAHVSGFAGERIPNLGRISGLDPAGPYFRSRDPETRLDKSDTEFLDVIHTDTGNTVLEGLGINEIIGDLDFYPNGGSHQVGCEPTLENFTVAGIDGVTAVGDGEGMNVLMTIFCDHNRALELYTASINNAICKLVGTKCEDYETYEKGDCKGNLQIEMGFFAKKDPEIPDGNKYYLQTTGKYPFCE